MNNGDLEIETALDAKYNIDKQNTFRRGTIMIEQLIAEATECDFKVALEIKKPKSWLKSVSAFSNGIGGTLFFGISDDREPIGLSDVQSDAEAISRLIKERITPLPQFNLKPFVEDNKNLLAIEISSVVLHLIITKLMALWKHISVLEMKA